MQCDMIEHFPGGAVSKVKSEMQEETGTLLPERIRTHPLRVVVDVRYQRGDSFAIRFTGKPGQRELQQRQQNAIVRLVAGALANQAPCPAWRRHRYRAEVCGDFASDAGGRIGGEADQRTSYFRITL